MAVVETDRAIDRDRFDFPTRQQRSKATPSKRVAFVFFYDGTNLENQSFEVVGLCRLCQRFASTTTIFSIKMASRQNLVHGRLDMADHVEPYVVC